MGKETADWNQRNQETAKAWGRQAIILKWLNYQAYMFYQKLDLWLGIPAFFLSSAMGTALVGSAVTDDAQISEIITWISAVLSFLTAGLIGVLFYLDPSTLSQRHLQKSTYFDDAYHDIQLELSMDPDVRQNAGWFLQFVQRKLALAQNLPPIVPQRFWSQRPMDVVHGHLAQDLRELDKYFTNVLGSSLQNPAPIPTTLHEVMSSPTVLEGGMKVEKPPDQEKQAKEFSKMKRGEDENHDGDISVDMSEEVPSHEEDNDYINRMELHDELQKELKRIRQEHKQRRYEYQMQRFLHTDVTPIIMKPPNLEEL